MSLFVLAFALLLGVLLWFLATDDDDPDRVNAFDVPKRTVKASRTRAAANRMRSSIPGGT